MNRQRRTRKFTGTPAAWALALCFSAPSFSAQIPEAKKIEDNSFLIEEAYNQEDGVIQHIQTYQLMKDKTWGYTFTQEWPVPKMAHQLSYTIPINHPDPTLTGLGDILINYRYQLISKEGLSFSPRLSILLPTGDYKQGLGNGSTGVQFNLPLSVALSNTWVTHWNLGSTIIPDARNAARETSDLYGFNFGTSFIYLVAENFNLMCEGVWNATENVPKEGATTMENAFYINPGFRFALNFKNGLQIVPGLAAPIGIGPSTDNFGLLSYLSFEHPMF